ncbi:MAG TPA: glycoside hydrolase family 3 N-terminal domain-containing protein [Acidobacteriota bacterium]|nr:glycoside hydrolase family 3 N-terminal domain-containing protein [Acidobacteriota bacterium]
MKSARRLHWIIATVLLACSQSPTLPADEPIPPYKDPKIGIEKRVEDLLARMTLDEKIGQMSQAASLRSPLSEKAKDEIRMGRWGSFLNAGAPGDRVAAQQIATREGRLGIPLIFGRDVIHGYRTIFPIPLGQAASWDPHLVRQAARVAAREAASDGIHWTFAPMLDIARDPRWGRIAESPGEDPYLASVLAAAMVHGFQGESLDLPDSIAACAKHYVGYGAAEGGRDYNTTWIPENLLRNVYLRPFRAARDAGVATFMSAFNDLNGIPASGNSFTLRQVLRHEWRFDGFVVSDYNSVVEMVPHGYAADAKDAALKGVRAGVDMEMTTTSYHDNIKPLIEAGQLDPSLVDEAVRGILRIKFRLGLFDRATTAPAGNPALLAPDAREIASRLAAECIVLLKSDKGVLPLAKSIGRIAVIGPLADSPVDQMGTWVLDGRREDVRTPLAAFRQVLGEAHVAWAAGLKNSRDSSPDGFAAALEAARSADAVLLFLGEEQILSGEAHSRAFLDLPGAQEQLVDEVAKARKPTIAVIMAGRPLTFHSVAQKVNAILYAWHPGTMGGPAVADIVFGTAVPSGKLPVTFPRTVGQVPIYYAHMNTGRPPSANELGIPMGTPVDPKGYTSKYLDVDFTPEYPFGFGLSYTTFEYSHMHLSTNQVHLGGKLTISAEITNAGAYEADEVVQLYVRDLVGSVTRPVRELRGFRRIHLKAGEKQTAEFNLTTDDLAFYNDRNQLVTEPGAFHIWIAPDSASGLRGEFEVIK